MAQTITFPETISFAKNPIVVSFKSESDLTFQKAVCESTLRLKKANGEFTILRTEKYSIPLNHNSTKKVLFDLSGLAQIAVPAYDKSPQDYPDGIFRQETIVLSAKVYEEYLIDASTPGYIPPLTDSFPYDTNYKEYIYAIPGGLTDYERLSLKNDITSLIGNLKILSRKPDGELVHPDGFYLIPAISNTTDTINSVILIENGNKFGGLDMKFDLYRCFVYKQSIREMRKIYPLAQSFRVSIGNKLGPQTYIGKKGIKPYHFIFSNGFGLMESITCYAHEKKTVESSTTESVYILERNFKNVVSSFTKKGDNQESFLISTGIINMEWQEWFITEFFKTDECYMYIDDVWVPVSIIVDDKITAYDFSKPEPISLDFTVKPKFTGSLNNKFVKE